MANLTQHEVYLAMYAFLENEYSLTNSDDIGGLLGSMLFVADGGTANPAAWLAWEEAVRKVKAGEVDARLFINKSLE